MDTSNLLTKRNIIALIIFALLLIAIPLGVYLAQKTQIFKPRATAPGETSPAPEIKFRQNANVSCDAQGNNCTTTSNNVEIELTAPNWEQQ